MQKQSKHFPCMLDWIGTMMGIPVRRNFPMDNSPDIASVEAVAAAASHAEAVENARKSQLESAILSNRDETLKIFTHAMREVLTTGEEGTKALLIQKIPLLCTDILKIKGDLFWIKWLLCGLVSGVGLLSISLLANVASK